MSKVIHKWPLNLTEDTVINTDICSSVLDVQIQNNNPVVWILHNPDCGEENKAPRVVIPVMTGRPGFCFWAEEGWVFPGAGEFA